MTRSGAWNRKSFCSLVVRATSVFPGRIISSIGSVSALVSLYVSVWAASFRLLQKFTVFLYMVVLRLVVHWVQSACIALGVERQRLKPRSLIFSVSWRNTGLTQLGLYPKV